MAKKKKPELRISKPSTALYKKVKDLADQNKRSIPKQLEIIIEAYKTN